MRRAAVTAALVVGLAGLGAVTVAPDAGAADDCTVIATIWARWTVSSCPTDPKVTASMEVFVDGVSKGAARYITVAETVGATAPQVAVVYADGFVRLKPGADPVPAVPFGASFVLGPGYWSGPDAYHHNPHVERIDVLTAGEHFPSVVMLASGTNGAFDVDWQLTLLASSTRKTEMHVRQTAEARTGVTFPPNRVAEHQAYKTAAQISTMFQNKGGTCAGHTDCHDVDVAHYVDAGGVDRLSYLAGLVRPGWIFPPASPPALAPNGTLSAIHTDNRSWQGATPSVRVRLLNRPSGITPQGWISTDPTVDDENVGLWLAHDARAAAGFTAGQADVVEYLLIGEDAEFPVVGGSTWFTSGQGSAAGPSGSTVSAHAVGAFANIAYELVSGRPADGVPCALDVEPLNPTTRFANSSSGLIPRTVATMSRPPGTWQICFYEVTPGARGRVATAPVTFTVLP